MKRRLLKPYKNTNVLLAMGYSVIAYMSLVVLVLSITVISVFISPSGFYKYGSGTVTDDIVSFVLIGLIGIYYFVSPVVISNLVLFRPLQSGSKTADDKRTAFIGLAVYLVFAYAFPLMLFLVLSN